MKPDQPSPSDEICVVCGKDTTGNRGYMVLHLDGHSIPLCCPQCKKVYEENPALYVRRQDTRETIRDIEDKLGW